MSDNQLKVRVPDGTKPAEIEEYFREQGISHSDYILHGRQKGRYMFTFADKQKAMMFKLRFGG
jgi:hypothetical protein